MPKIVLGIIFIVIAGVSFWDGYRITTMLRRPGVYDSLGPDRYLMTVGILILILGIALAAQGYVEMRQVQNRRDEESGTNRHIWLFIVASAYPALIWVFGYVFSTLIFFVAALWIMGHRDWRWNLSSSVALAAAFFFLFEYAADISLPRGVFG